MEEIKTTQQPDPTFKKYFPIVTSICCLISIALFIGINVEGKADNWDVYRKWGAPSEINIFGGDYWGLITSNFLHVEIWHIAFNLYWFWQFGKKVEFETKKVFICFFILSSALASSLGELAFSGTTGMGLSGIGYSFFGFLYVKSKTTDEYKNYIDKKTVNFFLFWLVLCFILTRTGTWTVANAAHVCGLLWGLLLAYISKYDRFVQWSVAFSYLAILTILISRNPFSTSYLSYRAYELHKSQRVEEAIEVYKEILQRDPDSEFAKDNLKQLEVHRLEQKAIDLFNKQKFSEAGQIFNQILAIDKDNQWAKENLSILPVE